MVNVYVYEAGNTLGSHEKFLKKLAKKKRGKRVDEPEKCDVTIVFCPIVSRLETDIRAALSSVPVSAPQERILVAMHHTFDPNYPLPNQRDPDTCELFVNCLFFENKGLFKCRPNKIAIKTVRKKLKELQKEKKKKKKQSKCIK